MEVEDIKIDIDPDDYKFIVSFSDQTECYLCKDLDEVNTCVKDGLKDNPELDAHILTFHKYKKATYKISYE